MTSAARQPRKRRVRLGVVALALLSLLAPSTPAGAITVKALTFVGTINISGCAGLGHVGVHGIPDLSLTTTPGPKGEPRVNVPVGGQHCWFHLDSTTCVKASVGTKAGLDPCFLSLTGTIWGFCEYSTGMGMATISDAKGPTFPAKATMSAPFKFTNVRHMWAFSGGDAQTHFYAEVRTIPTIGNCAQGTATGFTQQGEAVFKDITP